MLVPVSCGFYYKYYNDRKILCKINDRVTLSHNHNNILDKLVRVKCDVAGKDFIYTGPAEREKHQQDGKICYCELCGQEYGSLNPGKDIVINHFDACLAKHKGMAKSIGLQCSKK